jgi:hypothetical protein
MLSRRAVFALFYVSGIAGRRSDADRFLLLPHIGSVSALVMRHVH